ncbi:MAG: type II toxin-antitoxin system PemK/MazF family toxin [Actinomycetota bacterium]
MRRGEVWWSDVPGLGRRPVLVLSRDVAIPVLGRVAVALLTTTVRDIPTEVLLDTADGVPRRSVVSLDNIYTISKRRLTKRLTRLSEAHLVEVCAALRFAVDC